MSLFGKKICFGCGKQVSLFDSVKMCGGNLCNECSAKFSPYVNKSKLFNQNQVIAYLRYREKNILEYSTFKAMRSFGEADTIFIDEQKQKFYIKNLTLGAISNISDIIDFSSITDCKTKVDEKKITTQSDNTIDKLASIVNPSYTFTFNFYFNISLNHPWIDQLQIKLNPKPIQIKVTAKRGSDPINPRLNNPDCIEFERMGEEIKNTLLKKSSTGESSKVYLTNITVNEKNNTPSNAPTVIEIAARCPYCGAPIKGIKNTTGQCNYCGGYCSF